MLRKLKLYGELAEFVGHKSLIQVDSLQKQLVFLLIILQVEKYMNPKYYRVKVGNYAVNEEEIHHPIGQEDAMLFLLLVAEDLEEAQEEFY